MDIPYFLKTENIIKEEKGKSNKTIPKLGALAILTAVVVLALFKRNEP